MEKNNTGTTGNAGSCCGGCCSSGTGTATDKNDRLTQKGYSAKKRSFLMAQWPLLFSMGIIVVVAVMDYCFGIRLNPLTSLIIHSVAYLLAGYRVLEMSWRKIRGGDFFNEFVLMSVATLGAFYLGEYLEGVAVMVFYSIGEEFQQSVVRRAKQRISALLDVRPDLVMVLRHGVMQELHPSQVRIGEHILVRPGEKVALDGVLVSDKASFDTAALTGESRPDTKYTNEPVLAGMISLFITAEIRVTSLFKDSKLSRILEMVQDATARKSQTQLLMTRLVRVYTPIVFILAVLVVTVPLLVVENYHFNTWLYRSLVFLVISCPCGLVVSIPLGYFGGIGMAARNGILFKGGNFLDVMARVNMVVMDKTGTLTKGVFRVQKVVPAGIAATDLLRVVAKLEKNSTHPIAKAIVEYTQFSSNDVFVTAVEEIPGHGLKGWAENREVLAGNTRLMKKYGVVIPVSIEDAVHTTVVIAIDRKYAGYITIADEVREDAAETIEALKRMGIRTAMLSGDRHAVADAVARQVGIDEVYGDLLPEDKVRHLKFIKMQGGYHVAYAGDGVNDAPVVALADAGIAMGGLGSDTTIETADIVIQHDQPSGIVAAIKAGKITRKIVRQNIVLAVSIKVVVLVMGAGGLTNLWEAVIADVGVALLAILNAVRIQQMKL